MPITVNTKGLSEIDIMMDLLSVKQDDYTYQLKPSVGKGLIKRYYQDGLWNVFIGNFQFIDEVRFQREPDLNNPNLFALTFQTIKTDEQYIHNRYGEIKKAAEGIHFFANGASLNSVWHKNTESRLVFLIFTKKWIEQLSNHFLYPAFINDVLSSKPDRMFHIGLNAEIKQNLQQMLQLPTSVSADFIPSYIYNKCIELVIHASSMAYYNMNEQSKRLSIHPDDLSVIEKIKIELITNYQTPPTLEDLVEISGMSKSKLQRLFRAIYNTSVYQYIKDIRMSKSMDLLLQGHSVTEVGYEIGYSSIPNFTNTFKQYFNILPGQVAVR